MRPDAEVLAGQLGRAPRGTWRVVRRCAAERPIVIAVAPRLADGSPFPTTFWLTCPRLVALVHDAESSGGCALWSVRIATDVDLAAAVIEADASYRLARAAEGAGTDPCAAVGVAGQSDALAVKCLHARVAAALAGIADPVGERVAAGLDSRSDLDPSCDGCGGPSSASR